MTQIHLTAAQERALAWLPSDGAWRTSNRTISNALDSLRGHYKQLLEYSLDSSQPIVRRQWRLTPAGLAFKAAWGSGKDRSMSDNRLNWVICGRLVGTATGWDPSDTFVMQLYGFEPHPDYAGPEGDVVTFDFGDGTVTLWDDVGNCLETKDLIDAIAACPRRSASK